MTGRGLIIAAPASGSGKTLLTLGLLRLLREHGLRVAAAKAGPDYIDPTFHAAASGGAPINLDLWAMRPETLAGLVKGLEDAAEIVLCEGVMGLFDGTGGNGEAGSTADLAMLTGWPVLLVVDAGGLGASAAALLRGFAGHRPGLPWAGVVFNRVASERHRRLLVEATARHLPTLPVLGALPHDPALALPSRHLGLVPAGETHEAEQVIARAATHIGNHLEIDVLLAAARSADLGGGNGEAGIPPLGRHIAVARDDAFLFAYPWVIEGWRRQGADIRCFSPLAGEAPDPGADAVYLPGGYPELHAARLAAAERFIAGLHHAAAAGKSIYGECGGYMVLGERLIDAEGKAHPMTGLLPLETSFAERRLHLGYRTARLVDAGPLGATGAAFRGHEFHYATIKREEGAAPLFAVGDAAGAELGLCGLRRGSVFGSFLHLIDSAPRGGVTSPAALPEGGPPPPQSAASAAASGRRAPAPRRRNS